MARSMARSPFQLAKKVVHNSFRKTDSSLHAFSVAAARQISAWCEHNVIQGDGSRHILSDCCCKNVFKCFKKKRDLGPPNSFILWCVFYHNHQALATKMFHPRMELGQFCGKAPKSSGCPLFIIWRFPRMGVPQ